MFSCRICSWRGRFDWELRLGGSGWGWKYGQRRKSKSWDGGYQILLIGFINCWIFMISMKLFWNFYLTVPINIYLSSKSKNPKNPTNQQPQKNHHSHPSTPTQSIPNPHRILQKNIPPTSTLYHSLLQHNIKKYI